MNRSENMRRIRSKGMRPELAVRSLVHRMGYRFRLHRNDLPGKPDLVFVSQHKVIFVHGCFWHGHDCALFKWPQTRPEFWRDKIGRNRSNDAKAQQALLAGGWRVALVWECALRGAHRDLDSLLTQLVAWLQGDAACFEARGPLPPALTRGASAICAMTRRDRTARWC